jgi:hypothetical protein
MVSIIALLITCTTALLVDLAALLKVEKAQFKAVRSKLEPERPAGGFVLAQVGGYLFCAHRTIRRRDGEQDAQSYLCSWWYTFPGQGMGGRSAYHISSHARRQLSDQVLVVSQFEISWAVFL